MKRAVVFGLVLVFAATPLLAFADGFLNPGGRRTQQPSFYVGWAANGWMTDE